MMSKNQQTLTFLLIYVSIWPIKKGGYYMENNMYTSKFYREKPIKEFDINQTVNDEYQV